MYVIVFIVKFVEYIYTHADTTTEIQLQPGKPISAYYIHRNIIKIRIQDGKLEMQS